jgi:hypothetical protein
VGPTLEKEEEEEMNYPGYKVKVKVIGLLFCFVSANLSWNQVFCKQGMYNSWPVKLPTL